MNVNLMLLQPQRLMLRHGLFYSLWSLRFDRWCSLGRTRSGGCAKAHWTLSYVPRINLDVWTCANKKCCAIRLIMCSGCAPKIRSKEVLAHRVYDLVAVHEFKIWRVNTSLCLRFEVVHQNKNWMGRFRIDNLGGKKTLTTKNLVVLGQKLMCQKTWWWQTWLLE